MKESLASADILDVSILILSWVQRAGLDKLLTPRSLFFSVNSFQELLQCFILLFLLTICNNFNNLRIFLGDLNSNGRRIVEFETEDHIEFFVWVLLLEDRDRNRLLAFLVEELKLALHRLEVHVWLRFLFAVSHFNGLEFYLGHAICTLLTVHNNNTLALSYWVPKSLLFVEYKSSRLVVIQNSNTSASILSHQAAVCAQVVKLNKEVFIRLPAVVVNNLNRDLTFGLTALECNLLIKWLVVIISFSIRLSRIALVPMDA